MIFLLDSNVCIECLRAKDHAGVKARVLATPPADMVLCSVSIGELRYGAERSITPVVERAKVDVFTAAFVSLPFDDVAAVEYARIRVYLEAQGTPIGPLDTMIAAIARAHDLTLVTHNTAEFGRVPGLVLADWQTP